MESDNNKSLPDLLDEEMGEAALALELLDKLDDNVPAQAEGSDPIGDARKCSSLILHEGFANLIGNQYGITKTHLEQRQSMGQAGVFLALPLFSVLGLNWPDWQSIVACTVAPDAPQKVRFCSDPRKMNFRKMRERKEIGKFILSIFPKSDECGRIRTKSKK